MIELADKIYQNSLEKTNKFHKKNNLDEGRRTIILSQATLNFERESLVLYTSLSDKYIS